MPNRYAEERFREGKCMAAIALIKALEKEKLPRERGHFFKTGRIETYLDLDSPLQPRALLAVLRDAKVPHDNNCRFRPLAIYEGLEDLRPLPHQYLFGPPPDQAPVVRKVDPGVEETGNLEGEAVSSGSGRQGSLATIDQLAKHDDVRFVSVTWVDRPRPVLAVDEGIDSEGLRVIRELGHDRPGRIYAVDEGIDSEGKEVIRVIGPDKPGPVSKGEEPDRHEVRGAVSEEVVRQQVARGPGPVVNPLGERPRRPKRPGVSR